MVVDRINRWVMSVIRKRSGTPLGPITTDATGLGLQHNGKTVWSLAWADVERVTALRHPGFVGDTFVLIFEAGEDSHTVDEEQRGWSEMVAVLPSHLPGALGLEKWGLELVAGGEKATVTVYERDAGHAENGPLG